MFKNNCMRLYYCYSCNRLFKRLANLKVHNRYWGHDSYRVVMIDASTGDLKVFSDELYSVTFDIVNARRGNKSAARRARRSLLLLRKLLVPLRKEMLLLLKM